MSVNPSPVTPSGEAEANPHPLPHPALPSDVMHRTKVVDFFGRRTPIVCQDRNGPCPLFAICNVLLLKGVITVDSDAGEVSEQKLLSLVGNCLKNININQETDEVSARTREQNVKNVFDLLPRLSIGIFMNMILTKIDAFEFTTERVLFDLLGIPVYHGWVVDPKDTKTVTAIGSKSYNALASGLAEFKSAVPEQHKRRGDLEEEDELTRVLKLSKAESGDAVDGEVTLDISLSHSSSTKLPPQSEGEAVLSEQADKTEESVPCVDDKATKWELIENFLQTNATQLTAHGLCCLHKDLKESEICVFFRNNHFNTMIKYNGRLYLLANDQGFINQTDLVWQRLDEVNGGRFFVTSNFTLFKSETPKNDSWKEEQAMMSIDRLAQSDNSSGEIPSADPTDDKMSDTLNEQYLAHGSKLLTFDASVVNDFIVKKEWEDLDDYLGKCVATVLKKTPDEVVMMHPGLFMIPRVERLLDMLSDQNFEEAYSFYQSSIELLRGCQGRFAAVDLIYNIDELSTGIKTRSMPATRCSAEQIGTRISDYILLYFPSVIRQDDGPVEGVWQFAMRLPKLDKLGRDKQERVYYEFRCLLCGWVTKGSYTHLRSHFLQSKDIRSCPKVTEDVLDRLRATGEAKDLPTLEYVPKVTEDVLDRLRATGEAKDLPTLEYVPKVTEDMLDRLRATGEAKDLPTLENVKDKFSKKRKSASSNIVSWVSGSNISSTGSNTSGAAKSKRPRVDNSLSLDTPTSQMKPQLPVSPPMLSDKVTNPLLMMVGKLSKETAAILGRLTPSVVPGADDRLSITIGVIALQRALIQLREYARVHATHPVPEELSRILGLLEEATEPFIRSITASTVPDDEDRLFLMGRVAALQQMLIEISTSILWR